MRIFRELGWYIGVFSFVALFAAGSYYFGEYKTGTDEPVQFTELSTDEVNLILAVKAEMNEYRFTD